MACQLFEPAQLGPLKLKNRAVRSATNEHVSHPEGQPTPEWVRILAELAGYEVGLIITGHMTVDRTQRAAERQSVLDSLNLRENHRTDEYGGFLENRFRLPGRILAAVRAGFRRAGQGGCQRLLPDLSPPGALCPAFRPHFAA